MNALDPFEENDFRAVLTLLAEDRPEPAVTDLVAAQQAWALAHRPALPLRVARSVRDAVRTAVREHPRLVLPALAGLALVLVLGALAVLPALHVSRPQPATTPSGPGALPDRLFVPPASTPLVTDEPISRAAYLVVAGRPNGDGNIPDQAGYVVGADGGEYRRLPEGAESGVLSADGRLLAWAVPKPEGDGERPVRALARVRVLDLATGRTGDVTLPSVFNADTSVDGLDLDAPGRRLVVWGRDSYDGVSAVGAAFLVDLSPFVDGDDAPVLLDRCLRCQGPLAWLADGRLGSITQEGAPVVRLGGLGAVDLPPDPRTEGTSTIGLVGPAILVDAAGTTTYWVTSADPTSAGPPDTFTLLARGSSGDPRKTSLGRATEVRGLAVVPSGVLTVRWNAPPDGLAYLGEQRVDLVLPAGGRDRALTTGENGVFVQQVARDVAAGGRVMPGVAPVGSDGSGSRIASFARDVLVLLGGTAVVVGAVVLLGYSLSHAWWRPVGRRVRRLLRLLVRPRTLGLFAAGIAAIAGLVLLAAPAVVEPMWAAQQPRADARAPAVFPIIVADQRVRPQRAFDTQGRPRTVRVAFAFVTTVAQRGGVYALDPATAMLVRLDDLPGVPNSFREPGVQQSLAVSPSGRWVALWNAADPGPGVALVDLREAEVVVKAEVLKDENGWVAVDETGALRAVEPPVQRTTLDGVLPLDVKVQLPVGPSDVAVDVFDGAMVQMGYGRLPEHWWTWLGTPQAAALGRILAIAGGLVWLGLGRTWFVTRRAGRGSTRIRVPRRVGG
ncbi:hypothetical protein [Kineosporia sp. R_H_3]|uniref:hypothetical protein n=1 Tax=Kineosporia sp. R_H_3 TaxID=1961848 RepID=UPI000B4B5B6E|nr:hypothetical protein [Kineosporia sp. R_H_3]